MRVLVVGGTGVIGTRLVCLLTSRGHEVTATSRSKVRLERLRPLGAQLHTLDLLDRRAVRDLVSSVASEVVVHQATDLGRLQGVQDFRHFDRSFQGTNRLRTEGTDHLLEAASEAGVRRVVAQSFADHRYARRGGPVKSEEDRLDSRPTPAMRQTLAAMEHLDRAVTSAGGTALRYGLFYGEPGDPLVEAIRAGRFPLVGSGRGVWSFIHLDDAAQATVLAIEGEANGIFNIVDDEPAPTAVWLPEVARLLGARPPRHFPSWLAALYAGRAPVLMANMSKGASNAKAKKELSWTLRYPSWREGFPASYPPPAD